LIICTAHAEGGVHDFKLYQTSIGSAISGDILLRADSGYQGILKFHANSETPTKTPKGGELTAEQKAENRELSRNRILVENINAKIKVFKITASKYRNRRRRFGLRMALICGIINFESRIYFPRKSTITVVK
jgi:transposase